MPVSMAVEESAEDMGFESMWGSLLGVGRDPDSGGYHRFAWSDAELTLREWFAGQAASRSLDLVEDANGNQFAWWGDPAAGEAVLTGSHLDSVPDGGAFDGPLGVVSAFAALDLLRAAGVRPCRPLVVASFADEEGARFGVACTGSRLLTGSLAPDRALGLRDRDGLSLAEVLRRRGRDPGALGPDPDLLAALGCAVELHVEQGRGLVGADQPVGVASSIWPHGRWRFDFRGEANHAGTTAMSDRRDPMLAYAMTALAANKQARLADARATFGRVEVTPNGTNAVPSRVQAWLDARAPNPDAMAQLVATVSRLAGERAARDGTAVAVTAESVTDSVEFDRSLRDRVAAVLGGPAVLPTGAGHDAGVLQAAGVPSAMLFVRNPSGISHSPQEYAEDADCRAGIEALAAVLTDLVAT